jgi:protein-S-isoprenylcysteine O-methyltransferase Ste14
MDSGTFNQYLWVGFFALWMVWAIWTKPTQKREKLSVWSLYVLVTCAAFYVMFGGRVGNWLYLRVFPPMRWIGILSVLVTVAGMGLATWARACLGGNWSGTVTVKVGHELICTGPYRWVRHPIYTGIILALFGTAVGMGQIRGFVSVALLYVGFKIKSRLEERFMRGVFGAQYDQYSNRTGAIIPRLSFR